MHLASPGLRAFQLTRPAPAKGSVMFLTEPMFNAIRCVDGQHSPATIHALTRRRRVYQLFRSRPVIRRGVRRPAMV